MKKIVGTVNEMDGNTTDSKEDVFVESIKDDMPNVFASIDNNFINISTIDRMLDAVLTTKDVQKMDQVKKKIDSTSKTLEESEALVLKLEGELIEWNARNKLIRRDEELVELDELVNDFKDELTKEYNNIQIELEKVDSKVALTREPSEVEKFVRQKDDV